MTALYLWRSTVTQLKSVLISTMESSVSCLHSSFLMGRHCFWFYEVPVVSKLRSHVNCSVYHSIRHVAIKTLWNNTYWSNNQLPLQWVQWKDSGFTVLRCRLEKDFSPQQGKWNQFDHNMRLSLEAAGWYWGQLQNWLGVHTSGETWGGKTWGNTTRARAQQDGSILLDRLQTMGKKNKKKTWSNKILFQTLSHVCRQGQEEQKEERINVGSWTETDKCFPRAGLISSVSIAWSWS